MLYLKRPDPIEPIYKVFSVLLYKSFVGVEVANDFSLLPSNSKFLIKLLKSFSYFDNPDCFVET